jgi:hypothetical protein
VAKRRRRRVESIKLTTSTYEREAPVHNGVDSALIPRFREMQWTVWR